MASPEASCSSRNQAVEGPMLSGSVSRRAGSVAVYESYDWGLDASNKPLAPSIKSGISSYAFKGNSPLPKNASSTSVIHSSWIQRLKPSSQSCTAKDKPSTFSKKESFVCSHFTKDYSSCSRRLNKFTHHTRSSSWPPHGSQSKVVRQLAMEVDEPACDSPEEHDNAAAISPDLNLQNICVASSQSSEAGSRTHSQLDCRNYLRALKGFVPRAQLVALNRYTSSSRRSNDVHDSKERGCRMPESFFGQQFQDHIKDEKKAEFVALSEQANPQGRSQEVKNNNWVYFDGSFPTSRDFVSAPPLPVSACGAGYSSGASADADASNCYTKPFNFGALDEKEVHQLGFIEFDCKVKYPAADALRNKEKLDKFGLILPSKNQAVQDGLSMGFKDAVDLNLPQPRQNFNLFKGAAAKAYLLNGFSTGPPDNLHLSHLNYERAGACTRDDSTACGDGSGTVWTSVLKSQNLVSRGIDASCSRRYNPDNPHFGEEGQASRSPVSIKSLHEDDARVRIREKSLEGYWNSWVRLLEEPDHRRPVNTGHSKANLQQDFAGHYNEDFCLRSLGAKQQIGNLSSSKSHKPVNFAKDIRSYDSEQSLSLSKFSGPKIKSRQLIASADHISNFVVGRSEVSQEQYLYSHEGASGRVDSQPRNKNSGFHRRFLDGSSSHSRIHPSLEVINNETSRKESNMHRGWLQRWRSVEKFSAVSGKPLALSNSRSVSSDQLVKLPKSCIGSSHMDINPFEGNLTESGRGSNRYTEASCTRLDCGSASTPSSRPAGQNFAAFRSGYLGPSIEAMAIVGNSACKQYPTSLQNGGFYRLPCARPKTFKCVTLSEDGKDADEDKVHFVDLNDLRSLQGDIGNS